MNEKNKPDVKAGLNCADMDGLCCTLTMRLTIADACALARALLPALARAEALDREAA